MSKVDSHFYILCIIYYLYMFTDLSEEIDVYSDWIDACEVANQ